LADRRARQLLLYADLIIAVIICFVFYAIVFAMPLEMFPSPLQATYAKMFACLLLGFSISLAIFIAIDIGFSWSRRPIIKPVTVKPAKPKVRRISEALPVAFISKHKRLRKIAEAIGLSIASDIMEASETISPYRLAAKSLFFALLAFFISVPVGIALALLLHPFFLAVMAAPVIPLAYPKVKLRSAVGDRKRGVEDEIPFFTMYASILQSVGISLYNALLQTIGRGVFKQIERDALIVKRNVEFFFRSPVEALEETGKIHPNEKMKTLLLGYTSEWRSGGDLAGYLEAKADDYLKDMSFRWRHYGERSGDIGEATVSLLFILPMMILMSAFVFPSQALTMTGVVLSILIPLITVAVFGWINAAQPKTYDILRGDLKFSTIAFAATFASTFLLETPTWLCIAVSLAAAATFYGAAVFLQLREINLMQKALPQFLRDVTEYRKMGYDITRAIIKISEENTYNPVFDNLLRVVARQLGLGMRMAEVEVPARSWLTRMSFFLLSEVVESGGGTASCLEKLTNFVNHVVRVKRETRASTRMYQFLSAFTPVGLSLVTALMFSLLTAFAATLVPGVEAGILGEIAQIPKELIDMSYLLVLASSICIALLTAKAVDLTAKNTLWITINLSLAAGAIAFSTQIVDILMKTLLATF